MELKINVHTLNDELSCRIYYQMNKWHMHIYGEDITYAQCQNILNEYKYIIDYAITEDEDTHSEITAFFVTVNDKSILKSKLKDVPYYSFDLDIMCSNVPSYNDECLKNIIKKVNELLG